MSSCKWIKKLPSYKYKFKQIFKKIGQDKALDLFYFVAVLTWTVKVKNKHISVGLSKLKCRLLPMKRSHLRSSSYNI